MSRDTPDGIRIGGPFKSDDVNEDWDDDDSFVDEWDSNVDEDWEPDFDDDTYLIPYDDPD